MKRLSALLLPLALSGCMAEVLTTTAIQGELAARDAQAATRALNYAKESKTRTEAEYAIRTYQAERGAYPPSLQALVPQYLMSVPTHADGAAYGYDPATGTLLDTAAPAAQNIPFTAEDQRSISKIEDAIYTYWQATSAYPSTLDDLAPLYIRQVPTLSAGGSFIYDAQTGAVYHPNDLGPSGNLPPPAARPQRVGGGGAGPLGEATTSIGIQSQLSNMNSSGTQNTSSAARRSLGNISGAHNQQQQRALDQLDP